MKQLTHAALFVVWATLVACSAGAKKQSGPGPASDTSTITNGETAGESPVVATDVLQIPAIDLDGLKTIVVSEGPLKGFTVQAPSGIDPSTKLDASIDAAKDFPLSIDGNVALQSKIRIGLPDALLSSLDLGHPETISVYAMLKDGRIVELPRSDVSVEPPRLFVLVAEFASLVVVQGKAPVTFVTQAAGPVENPATIAWTAAPVGAQPVYELRVYDSTCAHLLQSQQSSTAQASIAPPLSAGAYCLRVAAQIGQGRLEQAGDPLLIKVTPPPSQAELAEFKITGAAGQSTSSTQPTVSWEDAPRLADTSVRYNVKICPTNTCATVEALGVGLAAATFTPSTALGDGLHYVRLTAKSGSGKTRNATNSDSFTFRVDSTAPGAFEISGAAAQQSTNRRPTITWTQAVDDSNVTYAVALATNSNCTSPAAQSPSASGTSFTPASDLAYATYYVCLTATDALGQATTATNSGTWNIQVVAPSAPDERGYLTVHDGSSTVIYRYRNNAFENIKSISTTDPNAVSIGLNTGDAVHYVSAVPGASRVRSSNNESGSFAAESDSLSFVTPQLAMAVDSAEINHVIYTDSGGLLYASGNNGTGFAGGSAVRTDPGSTDTTRDLQMALDPLDNPHVVFTQPAALASADSSIYYARRMVNTWYVSADADLSRAGDGSPCAAPPTHPSLAVARTTVAHVVYECDGNVIHATNMGGTWTYALVAMGSWPSVGLDSEGLPALSFFQSGLLKVARSDGSAWTVTSLGEAVKAQASRLVFDSHDVIHVFAVTPSNTLIHLSNQAGTFSKTAEQSVATTAKLGAQAAWQGTAAPGNRVKYQPDVIVSFSDMGVVQNYRRTSGAWILNSSLPMKSDAIFAFDALGRVRIAGSSTASSDYVETDNISGSFHSPGAIVTPSVQSASAMAVDSQKRMHFAYADKDDVFLKVETANTDFFSAAQPVRTVAFSPNASSLDMALDGSNFDHIVYAAPDSNSSTKLYYSTNRSGTMVTTDGTVLAKFNATTACSGAATLPRIAVTRSGKAAISYHCDGKLVVAQNLSGTWTYHDLGTVPDVESPVFIDSSDVIYVASVQAATGIMSVRWGPAFANVWSAEDEGYTTQFPQLAVDDLGAILLTYVESLHDKIRLVARYPNGAVQKTNIASNGSDQAIFSKHMAIKGMPGNGNLIGREELF